MGAPNVDTYKQCPFSGQYTCLTAYKVLASATANQEVLDAGSSRIVVYAVAFVTGAAGTVTLHWEGALAAGNAIAIFDTDSASGDGLFYPLPFPLVGVAGYDIDADCATVDDATIVVYYNLIP